uniref:Ribosomal protein L1 n=1 Tax=Nitzschia sp. NIES-3576 TaxID=2083273 RepID=A0A2Z5ZB63_9STRA|nr:ribosomal protein L1 [Nitzschia sp. NIES-3576]
MRERSKRYKKIKAQINQKKSFKLIDSISLLKKIATAKFIESIEVHIKLNINSKNLNSKKKMCVILPHTIDRIPIIAVLTKNKNFSLAKLANADIIGNDDLIEKILQNKIVFDFLIATPDMTTELTKINKILTLKKKMPSIKEGTITENLEFTIKQLKKKKLEYKPDKTGIIHTKIGICNFKDIELIENFQELHSSIKKEYSNLIKGNIFKNIHLCTTLSPAIKLDISTLN